MNVLGESLVSINSDGKIVIGDLEATVTPSFINWLPDDNYWVIPVIEASVENVSSTLTLSNEQIFLDPNDDFILSMQIF